MGELFRAALVIARRDFAATVLSRAFIFFLLGPLFPVLLGGVFGGIGARVAEQTQRPVVAVAMSPTEFSAVAAQRKRLAQAIGENEVVDLRFTARESDDFSQAKRLLTAPDADIRAVLHGTLAAPRLSGDLGRDDPLARQLDILVQEARAPATAAPVIALNRIKAPAGSQSRARALTGQLGQMLLFFLTILLSGMLLSQVIEEKSNKIIEVIAAAVRIDAMFLGKLFAMLAASLLGIVVWVAAGALAIGAFTKGGLAALSAPAVGWPAFLAFGVIYFAMNYLLLGAVFLGIGAQASTAREVQTLSMPVTFAQVVIFGFAATAVGDPDSAAALGAAAFPLSSPLVMIARAAEDSALWPHIVAITWQALWVGVILWFAARLFRRSVLKSGPQRRAMLKPAVLGLLTSLGLRRST